MLASSSQAHDSPSAPANGRQVLLGAGVLASLTILAYAPAIAGGFIWDDDAYVTANPVLRSFAGLLSAWVPGVTPQYYPVVFTTFWVEYQLWGLNAAGYHATNVLLHVANALLVWRLASVLCIPGAYVIALVFALHPIHAESVAWVTERKNVLSMFFYLLATHAYLRFDVLRWGAPEQRGNARDVWLAYGIVIAAFAAALLSKSVTASLPIALVLMMVWRGEALSLARLAPLAPMLLLGAGAGLHTAYLERVHVGAVGPDFDFTLIERIVIAARAFLFYPVKLALPWPLIFIYPQWEIDVTGLVSWLPVLICIALLAFMIDEWRNRARGVVLAIVFYAVTIFPALGFANFYPMRFSFVADHFVYHASLGLIALAVAGFIISGRNTVAARGLSMIVVAVLAALTFRQGFMYANEATLWRRTLELNPKAAVAHNNLAILAMQAKAFAQSEYYSREAIRLKPDDYVARINLIQALRILGKTNEALEQADLAIDALDRLIELHTASGREEEVDRLSRLKFGVMFARSDMLKSREK
jgi:tetratricopeptide (TPR) repeat protein